MAYPLHYLVRAGAPEMDLCRLYEDALCYKAHGTLARFAPLLASKQDMCGLFEGGLDVALLYVESPFVLLEALGLLEVGKLFSYPLEESVDFVWFHLAHFSHGDTNIYAVFFNSAECKLAQFISLLNTCLGAEPPLDNLGVL